MRFEFAAAQRIIFGPGTLREAPSLAKSFGIRALLVTGRNGDRCAQLRELLKGQGVDSVLFAGDGEPTVRAVSEGADFARSEGCDVIIGFGGGSALDLGKAIAALAANPGDPLQYLEVIGAGRPLERRPLPFMAIPTTAGTGSEVTRNAVLVSPEHAVKVSLRHPWMLPAVALVDPELTYDLPAEITASTGLDALTQLIEPYVSIKANPVTDAFCVEGIRRSARSLRRAWSDGADTGAREDLSLASLLGGLALANAGLGAVHGLAAPLGGLRPVPHGVACAALLPHVFEMNLRALNARATGSAALARYTEVARLITGRSNARAEDGAAWIRALVADLRIPRLSEYGLESADIPLIAERGLKSSSMQANPVALDARELETILEAAR